MTGRESQGDCTIRRLEYAIAFLKQDAFGQRPYCCFILDQKNRLRNAWRSLNCRHRFRACDGRFLFQSGFGKAGVEWLEPRRCEKLAP